MPERVAVVGAGMAGARVCAELRERGYTGRLVLVGAEARPPYDRPPLSKALLRGEIDRYEDLALAPDWYAGAETRFGTRATGLRPGSLDTTAGRFDVDAVVLAVGATPVRLPGDGSSYTLRTVDDAFALRAALTSGTRVVIVGAGWIGGEVATAAVNRGCAVTVLEAAATPLAVPLGERAGGLVAPWYAEAGADLRTGTRVDRIDRDGVRLAGGELLSADVVVEGVGVRRDLGFLAGSGVDVDDGVLTDSAGRSSVPGVFAVGDCAARWSHRAERRLRVEHWDDALNMPGVVARAVLGDTTASYDPVPYVWSEQFGRYAQWVGWRDGDPAVWRGDPTERAGWAAAWLDDTGRLTGLLAVDRPRDLLRARRVIAAGGRPDPDRLADPDVPVNEA